MASPPPPPPKPGAFSPTPAHYERPAPPTPARPHESSQFSPQPGPPGNMIHSPGPVPVPAPATQERWLPDTLKDKSKPDLESALHDPALLTALINAPSTTHPSLPLAQDQLQTQLQSNLALAAHVKTLESQIRTLRTSLTPSLLRTSALERQFRAKQEEMDHALSPWAPKAVHTRLTQGIMEQEAWCVAMEESFLDGGGEGGGGGGGGRGDGRGDGRVSDREVGEWVRRYREGRKVLELRREKRSRLEEGRVGGWR